MPLNHVLSVLLRRAFVLVLFPLLVVAAQAAEARITFNLPAGDAARTLKQFAAQAQREILFPVQRIDGVQTNAVQGELTVREGLDRLLAGTELRAIEDARTGALVVRRADDPNAPRAAQTESDRPGDRNKVEDGRLVLDKFEVFGSKSINADLPRSRDDVQPYVVFDRAQVQTSMATNLEEFFRARLPMNQVSLSSAQAGASNVSLVNLRGLGTNQTLVLLDGRRLPPRAAASGFTNQADLNGIPLGMIERIEILPSTASGIYGGGATGGVINIITRKDYSGVDVSMSYLNTFKSDSYTRRFELNGSFQLEGGRTMLTFNASRIDGTYQLGVDSDLVQRGRALLLANNPSAFYGAFPPPGYTTNIRNANGANLVLKSGTALNSPFTFVPVGYAGPATDGGAALVANAGKLNLDLPDTQNGRQSALMTMPDQKSYGVSLRRRFGDRVEILADISHFENLGTRPTVSNTDVTTTLPVTALNNPFTTPITVTTAAPRLETEFTTSLSRSDRVLTGFVVELPHDWSAGLDYVWAKSRAYTSFPFFPLGDPDGIGPGLSYTTAVRNGTLDVMRDLNVHPLDYSPYLMPHPNSISDFTLTAKEATVRGSGPLHRLPGGDVVLSVSAQDREEELLGAVNTNPSSTNPNPTYSWYPPVRLKNRAYTAEMRVPIFSPGVPEGWRRGLELQLAVRRDEITATARNVTNSITVPDVDGPFPDVSAQYINREYSATKATAGFKYAPRRDFTLRAGFGAGFLAPSLNQFGSSSPSLANVSLTDPKRGNTFSTITVLSVLGGNPDLQPEESKSVTAGVILTPRFLPGFRLSLDYTRIEKTNEIGGLFTDQLMTFEDRLPGAIVRAPLTPADQALGYTGGVIQQMDRRTRNIAGKRLTAYDLQLDYRVKTTTLGEFLAYAAATYQPDFSSKAFPDLLYTQLVGTSAQLKWRGNGGLTWKKGSLLLGWNMQYYDSYLIYSATSTAATIASQILNQGSPTIPSQAYHDIQLRYEWGAMPRGWRWLFANTQISLGVQNVFNTRPPELATTATSASAGYSTFGDPRLARYTITVRRHF